MYRLRLVVGNVVRSFGCGGGYTSSTRQRGVSIMGEFMLGEFICLQYNTIPDQDHFCALFFYL